jgi:hypothetical protein
MNKSFLLFLCLLLNTETTTLFSQACPACSNPALQSSEKLEAGLDSLKKGSLRLTLNATNGFNFRGGHFNSLGLSPEGTILDVPQHEHIVDLNFMRTELAIEYTIATNLTLWLRIPFDFKAQTASVLFTDPATPSEQQAILANRDNHHRTESYTGLSDFRFLLARRLNNFLGGKGRLDFAIGSTIPLGATEENPLLAGI